MNIALPSWFRLLVQVAWRACSRACAKTGKRMAARIAMMAITTSNSISVKPLDGWLRWVEYTKVLALPEIRHNSTEIPADEWFKLAGHLILPRHCGYCQDP